jgi:hypothetical protein
MGTRFQIRPRRSQSLDCGSLHGGGRSAIDSVRRARDLLDETGRTDDPADTPPWVPEGLGQPVDNEHRAPIDIIKMLCGSCGTDARRAVRGINVLQIELIEQQRTAGRARRAHMTL